MSVTAGVNDEDRLMENFVLDALLPNAEIPSALGETFSDSWPG
jgi:hypothetical protein